MPAGTFSHKNDTFENPPSTNNDDDDDAETLDPVQTQIPSHPGIKYLVRGIPPSDIIHRLSG